MKGNQRSPGLCLVHLPWSIPWCLDHKSTLRLWPLTKKRQSWLFSVSTWFWRTVHNLLDTLPSDITERDGKLMMNTFSPLSVAVYNKEIISDDHKPFILFITLGLNNCFNIYLFLRESQSATRGEAEREEDTESEAGSRPWAVSTEPDVGLELTIREILTWAKLDTQPTEPRRRPRRTRVLVADLRLDKIVVFCFSSNTSLHPTLAELTFFFSKKGHLLRTENKAEHGFLSRSSGAVSMLWELTGITEWKNRCFVAILYATISLTNF